MRLAISALLACTLPLAGQGVITTIAGSDYTFPDDGAPALNAALATPHGLALDGKGNLIIASPDLNQVLMLTTDGVIRVIAGTGVRGFAGDGAPARFAELDGPLAVAVDNSGIYIADTNNNRIRRIAPDGTMLTYAGTGGFSNSVVEGSLAPYTAMQPRSLAFDAQGNLLFGDSASFRLRRIDRASLVTTVAGNGQPFSAANFNAPPSPALSTPLNGFPWAIAPDRNGNIYFTDADELKKVDNSGRLSVVESPTYGTSFAIAAAPDGTLVLGGNGPDLERVEANGAITTIVRTNYGFAGDGGPVASALLSIPEGIAINSAGKIYFSDTYNDRIRTIDPDGTINTVAGKGRFTGDGGPASNARLAQPSNIVVKPDGTIYVLDRADYRIRRIAPDGTISTFAGTGIPGVYNGTALASQLNVFFAAIADDPLGGGILVADSFRVYRIRASGLVQVLAGTNSQLDSDDNGPATRAGIAPLSLGADAQGNIYIGEFTRLRKIDVNGIITTIAGTGQVGFSGETGLAVAAQVNYVTGVAADAAGNVYFTDSNNSRVRRIDTSGTIGTVASLSFPQALAFDGAGNLYVLSNGRIAKVNGVAVTDYLQPRGSALFGDGGPAAQAGFTLNGFAFDQSGNLYIADTGNQRIRLVLAGAPASISLSERSLTFQAGGRNPAPQSFTVAPSASWTAAATTISGGNWLQLAMSGATVQVSVNSAGLAPGSYYGRIDVRAPLALNSPQSVTVVLNVVSAGQPAPAVSAGGVLNAASFHLGAPLAPGSLISIFGQNLADTPAQAVALPLPTQLGTTSVTLGGRLLPLLYVGPGQINAMIPFDVPINATFPLIVQHGTSLSTPEKVSIVSGQPGIFTQNAMGYGAAIVTAVHPNGSQNLVTSDAPAQAGDVLVIYATGLGSVGARVLAGQASPEAPPGIVTNPVAVTIGGMNATPFFAGLTPRFTGLYQINVTVPPGLKGNAALVVIEGGVTSQPVFVAVQ